MLEKYQPFLNNAQAVKILEKHIAKKIKKVGTYWKKFKGEKF